MHSSDKEFCCPKCYELLERRDDYFRCSECQERYPIVEDLPVFIDRREVYEDELAKKILEEAEKTGWANALSTAFVNEEDRQWYTSTERGNGLWITSINEKSAVLDLGCGSGAISVFASRIAKKVYSIDPNIDRIKVLKYRVKSEGIENIVCAVSNERKLPFPPETFDLIILNGVLEWIPEFRTDKDPTQVALETLTELGLLLRPGGEIYLGIENRFGFRYLLGGRDEHTGLRFVTVLPRKISNLYHHLKKGVNYRRYTYSFRELKDLAKKSGLIFKEAYMPLRDYREVKCVIDLNYGQRLSFIFNRLLVDYSGDLKYKIYRFITKTALFFGLTKFGIQKYFTNCFSVVLGKEPQNIHASKIRDIIKNDFLPASEENKISLVIFSAFKTNTIFVFNGEDKLPFGVLRVESNRKLLEKEYKLVSRIKKDGSKALVQMINEPIRLSNIGNVKILSYPYLSHPKMVPLRNRKVVEEHFIRVKEFLMELSTVSSIDGDLQETLPIKIDKFADIVNDKKAGSVLKLKELYTKFEKNHNASIVHGDLHPGNIFLTKESIIVTDWEFASKEHPFFDWIHFVICYAEVFFKKKENDFENLLPFIRYCFEGDDWFCELVNEFSKMLLAEFADNKSIAENLFMLGVFTFLWKKYYFLPERMKDIVDSMFDELAGIDI